MSKSRSSWLPWLAGPALVLLAAGLRAAPPKAAEVSNPEITAAEVRAHIQYLASDELQGRASGTHGNDLAADYLGSRFRACGLKAAGDGGTYFQKFPVFTGARLGDGNELTLTDEHGPASLRVGEEFMPLVF